MVNAAMVLWLWVAWFLVIHSTVQVSCTTINYFTLLLEILVYPVHEERST